MYYANKQTFYIRQYGPAVIVSIISLLLIASGLFIYTKSLNPTQIDTASTQTVETAEDEKKVTENVENAENIDNDLQETNALIDVNTAKQEPKEEPKVEEPKVVKYFENLPTFEISKEVNVTNVSSSGAITVETDGDKLEIVLIGIDFKYSSGSAVNKIKSDLLNKKVKIAFDTVRSKDGVNYAYVYKSGSKITYNAELLKTGLVTLKSERKNTKLNKELADAQAYAREKSLGVWKK